MLATAESDQTVPWPSEMIDGLEIDVKVDELSQSSPLWPILSYTPHSHILFSALNLVWLLGNPVFEAVVEAVVEADKADEFGEPRIIKSLPLQLQSLSAKPLKYTVLYTQPSSLISHRLALRCCTVQYIQRESYSTPHLGLVLPSCLNFSTAALLVAMEGCQ